MTHPLTFMAARGMTAKQMADATGRISGSVRSYLNRHHIPHKRMGRGKNNQLPVLCRGVLYPSQIACARAIGVSQAVVWNALERGTIDRCGLRGSTK